MDVALAEYCGPEDAITSLQGEEYLRKERGFRGSQNLVTLRGPFLTHQPAADVKHVLGESLWRSYFKFTIERNPYDKAISFYWWRTRERSPRPSLSEFLREREDGLSNWPIYAIDDVVVADHVLRYEDLSAEMDCLCERFGWPRLVRVKAKNTIRQDRRHYREVLSTEDRRIVEEVCGREIEALGYEW